MEMELLKVTTNTRDKKVSMGNRENEPKLKKKVERGGTQNELIEERAKSWWCPERCWAPKREPFTRVWRACFPWSAQM
jgi:hypothetical protein